MLPLTLAVLAPPSEVETLRLQVEQLKAQNAAYSAEIARLGGQPKRTLEAQRRADDHRRLDELARRLTEGKPQPGVRAEAAALAERLALAEPASVQWETLLAAGVLRDGLTPKEAEALLGPRTHDRSGAVEWYHNPVLPGGGRLHVAPYLRAEVKDGKLASWKTGKR